MKTSDDLINQKRKNKPQTKIIADNEHGSICKLNEKQLLEVLKNKLLEYAMLNYKISKMEKLKHFRGKRKYFPYY